MGQGIQRRVQLLNRTGLLGSALGQILGPAGQLFSVAAHLVLGLANAANRLRQPGGQHINGLLNRTEIADKGCGGLHVEVAHGQLFHNPVQVPDVATDLLHRALHGTGQVAQLVVSLVLQRQVQPAFVEGLNPTNDVQNGGKDIFQHIKHQTGQAAQGQYQADGGNGLHQHNGGVHLLGALIIEGSPLGNHLVQLAHQSGQIRLNGLPIIRLPLRRVIRLHVQNIIGRLMQRLMQRLDLIPQS